MSQCDRNPRAIDRSGPRLLPLTLFTSADVALIDVVTRLTVDGEVVRRDGSVTEVFSFRQIAADWSADSRRQAIAKLMRRRLCLGCGEMRREDEAPEPGFCRSCSPNRHDALAGDVCPDLPQVRLWSDSLPFVVREEHAPLVQVLEEVLSRIEPSIALKKAQAELLFAAGNTTFHWSPESIELDYSIRQAKIDAALIMLRKWLQTHGAERLEEVTAERLVRAFEVGIALVEALDARDWVTRRPEVYEPLGEWLQVLLALSHPELAPSLPAGGQVERLRERLFDIVAVGNWRLQVGQVARSWTRKPPATPPDS